MPVLQTLELTKSYGGAVVVDHVTIGVDKGEVLCILGPSGAGKSTLLRCICHLEEQDSGLALLNGRPIGYKVRNGHLVALPARATNRQRRRIGVVFQSFNLFKHLTLLENVVVAPVKVLGLERGAVETRAKGLLDMVGLADKTSAYPDALSGGQQQRGAIARALAMEPDVVLFDEPTSALDPESIGGVLSVMENLSATDVTMVVVTHEIGFAKRAASRVVFMEEGRVVVDGDVESTLVSTSNERIKRFLYGDEN